MTMQKAKILCVDDEPNVLEGLMLNLRRQYDVRTAPGGDEALAILAREKDIVVLMSDMRMPGMNGAQLLAKARELAPDVTRMLLTGQADLDSAIAVVNEGQIFRFLTKPCPPAALLAAMGGAVEQNRLITAERVLLEQTLHGTIRTLMDVLGMTSPVAFGRAMRKKKTAAELAEKLALHPRWQLEVAAMLSQLAMITLPQDVVEKIYDGRPLSDNDQKMVARIPVVTEQLLKSIPRLETVRAMLAASLRPRRPADVRPALGGEEEALVERGAEILRVATDFNILEAQGTPAPIAVDTMRGRGGRYDPDVIEALSLLKCGPGPKLEIREVGLASLAEGMVFAEDVHTHNGALLVASGYEITAGFLERLRNVRAGSLKEPLKVIVRIEPQRATG